ncbi:MAG: DUF58 domain-containing protein [Verrucomicrobiota bacterium]
MVFQPRFFLILAFAFFLAVVSLWAEMLFPVCLLVTGLLLAAAIVDLTLVPRSWLKVERECPDILPLGQPVQIRLHLANRLRRTVHFHLQDSPPARFDFERHDFAAKLPGKGQLLHTYTLRCRQRGDFGFGPVYVRTRGPLRLVVLQETITLPTRITVLPDYTNGGDRDFSLLQNSRFGQGRIPLLQAGSGHEFESLREHRPDDDFRSIDWKATAKKGQLIARQYQIERDQRVLLMLDLGRLMASSAGPYRKLDYAINAAVRLAQLAIQRGDLVGVLLFGQEIHAYLPPRKGQHQFSQIVRLLGQAKALPVEPDYRRAFHEAARRLGRRSLVVCFTDLMDIHISESLVNAMRALRPRHLAMTVTMSDAELEAMLRAMPNHESAVYEYAAGLEVRNDYQRTLRSLSARGIEHVNVPADELTSATLQRYLEIKRLARL